MKNLTPKQKHSLWKRVVKSLRKEFPVLESFNMYGFVNGEDTNVYQTLETTTCEGWVKMVDYTIFGLRYPFKDATVSSIKQFSEMIKNTENYSLYINKK